MKISTPAELGDQIRHRRKAHGLSQDDLARLVPTSQKWVSEVENGKATAAIGQVMRLLSVLGISIDLETADVASGTLARKPHASRRRGITGLQQHDNQGGTSLSFGKKTVLPQTAPEAEASALHLNTGSANRSPAKPSVRFRRAVIKYTDQTLEEQSALVRDAFKRWGFK